MAAGAWSRFAHLIVGGGSAAPVALPQNHRDLVGKLLLIHTCMYVHNQVAASAGHGPYMAVERRDSDEDTRYLYRDPAALDRYRPCGMLIVSRAHRVENPGALMLADAHFEAVTQGRFLDGLRSAARDLGDRFLPHRPTSGVALLDVEEWLEGYGLVEMYEARLRTEVGRAAEASRAALDEEVRESIDEEGWRSAATFFMVISRNQALFHDALSAVPEATVGATWLASVINPSVDAWDEAAPVLEQWLARSEAVGPSGRVTTVRGDGLSGFLDLIPIDWLTRIDDGKPMESLVSMGHTMVNAGIGVLVVGGIGSMAGAPAKMASGIVGMFGKVGEVAAKPIEGVLGILKVVGWALVIGGILLAFVLPLIPFARFLLGIVSWLIAVAEGLIALPLFLALQIGGEGQGLVSRASKGGYLLVLHAVIRPVLMVFGLVFAYFVFVSGIRLFNLLFEFWIEGITNATTMGAVTALVGFGIYTILAFAVANVAFKAIDIVPQELMRWLGGYGRSGGDEAGGSLGILSRSVIRGRPATGGSVLKGR